MTASRQQRHKERAARQAREAAERRARAEREASDARARAERASAEGREGRQFVDEHLGRLADGDRG